LKVEKVVALESEEKKYENDKSRNAMEAYHFDLEP
jgi:hypothetical protein